LVNFHIIGTSGVSRTVAPRFIFGKRGHGLGEFDDPLGLAVKDDFLFVSDSGNDRVQVLQIKDGGRLSPLFVYGKRGTGPGEIFLPSGLAVKGDRLYFVDTGNGCIQICKIQPDGSLVFEGSFGKEGHGEGEFGSSSSIGIAVTDDHLYVAEGILGRVQVLKIQPDGSLVFQSSFGTGVSKPGSKQLGEFKKSVSSGIAVKDDFLFVADPGYSRVQVLKIGPDGDLKAIGAMGRLGARLGEFGRDPARGNFGVLGLLAKDDYLFVADGGNSRLQIFKIAPDGKLTAVSSFGKWGANLGEFGIWMAGLAIKDKYLYITDTRDVIQCFEVK
jgi:6-phosphogluconolactonase (cycloisomerase 2 family)